MTEVGQYAYLPKRLNEPSRLAPFALLYLHPVASFGEARILTSGDLPVTPNHLLHLDHHIWGEWP